MLSGMNEIGPGKSLSPDSEAQRLNYYAVRKRWFKGDMAGLNVSAADELTGPLVANWFRRVAEFFPELMFTGPPALMVRGVEPPDFKRVLRSFWKAMSRANVDMLRLGVGVIMPLPENPLFFVKCDPSLWFEVGDAAGQIVGDIVVVLVKNYPDPFARVYRLPISGKATVSFHKVSAGQLSKPLAKGKELKGGVDGTRKVVQVYQNDDQTSVFDGMAPSVGEISRMFTSLGATVKANLRPHLMGPEGMLRQNDDGKVELAEEGEYLEIPEGYKGDVGYLQWDSKIQAVQWSYNQHLQTALSAAGCHALLFHPEYTIGNLSGTALRRLSMPFLARLSHLKTVNEFLAYQLLSLWYQVYSSAGGKTEEFFDGDVMVEWPFDDLFEDDKETQGGQQPAAKTA